MVSDQDWTGSEQDKMENDKDDYIVDGTKIRMKRHSGSVKYKTCMIFD